MSEEVKAIDEKREKRRKRRKRNQILAYIFLILIIAVLAVGIVIGVKYLTNQSTEVQQQQEEQQTKVEEILKEEEIIEAPVIEDIVEPVIELTPEEKLDEIVNAGIEVMPLEDKVAGLFIVTPESITGVNAAIKAGDGTQKALSQYAVGGIIYFKKNIVDAEQLKALVDNTKLFSKYPLFIGIDEEGGSVSRIAEAKLTDAVPSAKAIRETGDVNQAHDAGVKIGTYLNEYGFNLDFAPVADLANVDGSIMNDRSYGAEANTTVPFVNAMLAGLREQKVTGCVKHFPGIGNTKQDTHKGMVVSEKTEEEFRAEEFQVFAGAIEQGANMIMVSHMAAPALTQENNLPCSLSEKVVTGYLRGELGFKGVIITDAMDMTAISEYYTADQAAIMALKAGCDMILMPENFETAYNGVLEAVKDGTISEERINDALRRVYRIKYADKIEME